MIRALSLGCGVQSFTLLAMSAHGELPLLDAAVFADTGWEPPWVYDQWARAQALGEQAGIRMLRVAQGNIRTDALSAVVRDTIGTHWASLPLYCLNPDGSVGMLTRQCTSEYKIRLIERCLREEVLQVETRGRRGSPLLEQWLGISTDEADRQTSSTVAWKTHRFPLIHDVTTPYPTNSLFPRGFSRGCCERWLLHAGFGTIKKSACVACMYRSNAEWLDIRAHPALWEDACLFDEAIRNCAGMRALCFVHRSCVPLRVANLGTSDRWDQGVREECAGVCGV